MVGPGASQGLYLMEGSNGRMVVPDVSLMARARVKVGAA